MLVHWPGRLCGHWVVRAAACTDRSAMDLHLALGVRMPPHRYTMPWAFGWAWPEGWVPWPSAPYSFLYTALEVAVWGSDACGW